MIDKITLVNAGDFERKLLLCTQARVRYAVLRLGDNRRGRGE